MAILMMAEQILVLTLNNEILLHAWNSHWLAVVMKHSHFLIMDLQWRVHGFIHIHLIIVFRSLSPWAAVRLHDISFVAVSSRYVVLGGNKTWSVTINTWFLKANPFVAEAAILKLAINCMAVAAVRLTIRKHLFLQLLINCLSLIPLYVRHGLVII